MTVERDNLKAGLFVLAAIVLGLAIVFTLTDLGQWLEKSQKVRVAFNLSDGLQGLKQGAAVTLGDQPIGHIAAIRDQTEEREGQTRVVGKIVTVQIPARYRLFANAVLELKKPALGENTKLNIRSVGSGLAYEPDMVLEGGIAPIELAQHLISEMGIRDAQREQLRQLIANAAAISDNLRQDLPSITSKVNNALDKMDPLLTSAAQAVEDLRQASGDVRQVVGEVRQRSGSWLDRVDSISMAIADATNRFKRLLEDKEPALRSTVDNVHQLTQALRENTPRQVTEALDKATAALENFKQSSEQIKALVVGQRPVLERAMANAQLTTDQLKLAAIEIRRSPWRLLYRPGDKELETDNLYDAARSFALAAGSLDATVRSLRAVAEGSDRKEEEIQKMIHHLEVLFMRYEEAENSFWEALKDRPPSP